MPPQHDARSSSSSSSSMKRAPPLTTDPPRRQSASAPSSPVAAAAAVATVRSSSNACSAAMSSRANFHSPQPAAPRRRRAKLIYESPRLVLSDSQLFPAAAAAAAATGGGGSSGSGSGNMAALRLLQNQEARWRYMSALAGEHRQDATVLRINPQRVATPSALQAGMLKHAAQRIVTLHLPILQQRQRAQDDADDCLGMPALAAWLDAIVATFPNVRHLYLQQQPQQQQEPQKLTESSCHVDGNIINNHDDNDATNKAAVVVVAEQNDDKYAVMDTATRKPTATMAAAATIPSNNDDYDLNITKDDESLVGRRLYVLYRIPDLETLDGKPVTVQERKLARPRDRGAARGVCKSGLKEEDGWVEQAHAKVTAANLATKKVDGTVCLLDDADDEEEEDEENDDPAAYWPLFRPRREETESAVEVDVNGLPLCSPDRPVAPRHRRSLTADDHVIRSPPSRGFRDEGDIWEYASVESSAVCEWTAACGGLSLPYFRKLSIPSDRERIKSRWQLNLKRNDKHINVRKTAPGADLIDYSYDSPSEEVVETSDFDTNILVHIDGHHEMIFEGLRPQIRLDAPNSEAENRIKLPPQKSDSPTSTSTQSSSASLKPIERPRVSASESLTSPFPMQFRVRAKAAISPQRIATQPPAAGYDEQKELKVMTDFPNGGDGAEHRRPPRPREAIMETIEFPIMLSRTQSSPSKLPSSFRKSRLTPPPILTKGELPPPCPGGRRKMLRHVSASTTIPQCNSSTKASSRKSRRGTQWREKLSARSFSIMDDNDDDDSFLSSDEDSLEVGATEG